MNKSPEVSVALATFNGARHLAAQLSSIADQRLLPAELVVCDDGSSDDTLTILHCFADKAPFPVRVHRNPERLGYRRNFRRAAGLCRHDLIAFCDQDDIWHEDKLQQLAAAFADDEVLLAYHNANVVDAEGSWQHVKLNPATERAEISAPFLGWKSSYGLLQMFRASLRRFDHLWDLSIDHNDPAEILAHDQWYFFLAGVLGRIAFVDQVLLDYRQHGSNLYGAPQVRGLLAQLRYRFVHYGGVDADLASAALARSRICQAIVAAEPDKLGKVLAHQRAYEQLGRRLERRYRTYSRPTLVGRAASLVSSVAAGDYQGRPRGFEPASVIRDAWSGVVLRQISPS